MDGRLYSGDEIVAVDGQSVMGASHHVVVGMMGSAAQRAQVQLTVRRRAYQGEPINVTTRQLRILLQSFELLRYSPLSGSGLIRKHGSNQRRV
jgi:C-terminal processing protease CtpA/Prc